MCRRLKNGVHEPFLPLEKYAVWHASKVKKPLPYLFGHANLSPTGVAIIDINNRQNIKQYGWRAVRNFIKDTFCYKFRNGNIDFLLDVHNNKVPASVHLFSKKEFETLLEKSGLAIQYCHFINYQNGNIEKNSFAGQLCYVLRAKI